MERRHPRTLPTRPLVLIVDGDDEMSALYALALLAGGFDVVPANDGETPYDQALATRPDVIVTELHHLQSDGWVFVHALKRDTRTRGIPVVVLADSDEPSVRERAAQQGCTALFVTPLPPEHLIFGLRELLSRSLRDEGASIHG